jgi:hypothetical protein
MGRELSKDELRDIVARDKPGFRLASASARSDRSTAEQSARARPAADAGTPNARVLQQRAHEKRGQLVQKRDSTSGADTTPRRSPLRDLFLDPDDYGQTGSLAESEANPLDHLPQGLDADDDVEDAIIAVKPVDDDDTAPFDAAIHQPKTVVVSGKDRKITSTQG